MISKKTTQMILEKRTFLQEQLDTIAPENAFINKFIQNNNLQNLEVLIRMDLCDFFTAFILSKDFSLSYYEISQKVLANKSIFNETSTVDMVQIIEIIKGIVENANYKDLKSLYLKKSNQKLGWRLLKEVKSKSRGCMLFLENFLLVKGYSNIDIMELLDLCRICSEDLIYGMQVIGDIKKMRDIDSMNLMKPRIAEEFSGSNLYLDKLVQLLDKKYSEIYCTERMEKAIRFIQNYNQNIQNYDRKRKMMLRSEIKNYQILENWIKSYDKGQEIIHINGSLMKIGDENIRRCVLEDVYMTNLVVQEKVEQEYHQLLGYSQNQYQVLFNEYGISLDKGEGNKLKDFGETKNILKKLVSFNITDSDVLVEVLGKTNYQRVEEVSDLVVKGYLDERRMDEYVELFDVKTNDYSNFMDNVLFLYLNEFVSKEQIRNTKVLQKSPQQIKTNIEIIDNYHFLSSLKNTLSIDFLGSSHLEEKIDQELELGFEKFLVQNLDLLNERNSSLGRLIILRRLGYPISDYDEVLEVLGKRRFIIGDEELEQYIFDRGKYIDDDNYSQCQLKTVFLERLEPYCKTERIYNINGVVISQNKVQRNLALIPEQFISEMTFLQCLLKNSIVEQEEYDKVVQAIEEPAKKYRK